MRGNHFPCTLTTSPRARVARTPASPVTHLGAGQDVCSTGERGVVIYRVLDYDDVGVRGHHEVRVEHSPVAARSPAPQVEHLRE